MKLEDKYLTHLYYFSQTHGRIETEKHLLRLHQAWKVRAKDRQKPTSSGKSGGRAGLRLDNFPVRQDQAWGRGPMVNIK